MEATALVTMDAEHITGLGFEFEFRDYEFEFEYEGPLEKRLRPLFRVQERRLVEMSRPFLLGTLYRFVATNDTFGESGTPFKLMKKYGLDSDSIVKNVKKVISRKK